MANLSLGGNIERGPDIGIEIEDEIDFEKGRGKRERGGGGEVYE